MGAITRQELQRAFGTGAPPVLLEALPAEYYADGHLPGAASLPLDELDELAGQLIPTKAAMVVTYCSGPTCSNSKIAAKRLEQLGYTNVFAYEGGKQDWTDAGLALERDEIAEVD